MSDNGGTTVVTPESVNSRVDQMGAVFVQLNERVQRLEKSLRVHIGANMDELHGLLDAMEAVQVAIDSAPALKRQASEELAELREDIVAIKERQEDIKAELYLNVTAELDDITSKPVYTSDPQRKAAFRLALSNRPAYQELKEQERELNISKAKLDAQLQEIEHTYKVNRWTYQRIITQMENITARISL